MLGEIHADVLFRYTVDEENEKGAHDTHSSTRDMKLGRLSFMEVLSAAPSNAQVGKATFFVVLPHGVFF